MHADHHLGLLHLLELRATLKPNGPPLVVVGPQALQRWLRTAAAALHTPLYFRFVHCGAAPHDGTPNNPSPSPSPNPNPNPNPNPTPNPSPNP